MSADAPRDGVAVCPVCEWRGPQREHRAEEKMFGSGGSFTYLECRECGSLSLRDVPPRLAEYYPPSYYSLVDRGTTHGGRALDEARKWAMAVVLRNALVGRAVMAGARSVGVHVEPWTTLLAGSRLRFTSPVLDVGCGDGHRLRTLQRFGFRDLTGVDAHLVEPTVSPGIALSRTSLDELEGAFDLVMFHHSFEHMADPLDVLRQAHRVLTPTGLLLLRVPLAGTWAWRTYGVDWVQLDAPRHLFLFTAGGLTSLAERAGFRLARTVYDSGPFQFWGSELYRQGTSLQESGSVDGAPPPAFPAGQVERWERRARMLNEAGDGDQAAFVFTKARDAPPARSSHRPSATGERSSLRC